jgi:hypothetical protein
MGDPFVFCPLVQLKLTEVNDLLEMISERLTGASGRLMITTGMLKYDSLDDPYKL